MLDSIPPRERQIIDLLYAECEATVGDIRQALPVKLSDQAVRAMLTRLETKGFVRRTLSPRGFVFSPAVAKKEARQSALSRLVATFFDGSALGAASALLGMADKLDDNELAKLEEMIAKARQERKP